LGEEIRWKYGTEKKEKTLNGDGRSSKKNGEEELRLRTPRLSQREKRDEKKGKCKKIFIQLIVTRWIWPGKEIEREEFLRDEY